MSTCIFLLRHGVSWENWKVSQTFLTTNEQEAWKRVWNHQHTRAIVFSKIAWFTCQKKKSSLKHFVMFRCTLTTMLHFLQWLNWISLKSDSFHRFINANGMLLSCTSFFLFILSFELRVKRKIQNDLLVKFSSRVLGRFCELNKKYVAIKFKILLKKVFFIFQFISFIFLWVFVFSFWDIFLHRLNFYTIYGIWWESFSRYLQIKF